MSVQTAIKGQVSVTGTGVVISVPTYTRAELQRVLMERSKRGAFIVTLVSRTEPDMNKTGNPYTDNVFKVSRCNGVLNWSYENAVNAQREREDKDADFEAKPRKWGTRIPHTCLVEHKGSYYLEMKVENTLGVEYQLKDGTSIDKDVLSPWLKKSSKSGNQEVDRKVVLRDFKVDNVVSITMDGQTYLVR